MNTGIIQELEVLDMNDGCSIGFGHFEWNNRGEVKEYLNSFDGKVLVEGWYYVKAIKNSQLVVLNRSIH